MSAAPSDKPVEPVPAPTPAVEQQTPPQPARPDLTRPPRDAASRLFLAVSAVVLLCWFGWLSITAFTKSREPIVSRAQAAVAPVPVVARVEADEKGGPVAVATVIEPLKPDGPPRDSKILVMNLPTARGFAGAGEYLLLLVAEPIGLAPDGQRIYYVVVNRSSGPDSDTPIIYPWSPDVAAQVKRLYRAKD